MLFLVSNSFFLLNQKLPNKFSTIRDVTDLARGL